MRYFFRILILVAVTTSAQAGSGVLSFDGDGFVNCYAGKEKTYFFFRDARTQADSQVMTFIAKSDYEKLAQHRVQGCKDVPFLKDFPAENLKRVVDHPNIFPIQVYQSAQQLAIGGRKYRTEKTAQEYFDKNKSSYVLDQPEKITYLKSNYGKKFAGEVMSIWIKNLTQVYGSNCEQFIGSCDFYLCQESRNPCGIEGYNLGYGYKYCSVSKFALYSSMATSLGQNWVKDVFTCLQGKNLEQEFSLGSLPSTQRCEEIRATAMDAHPSCYVQGGFCRLALSEKMKIFNAIKSEIFSPDTIPQGLELLNRCGDISGATTPKGDL